MNASERTDPPEATGTAGTTSPPEATGLPEATDPSEATGSTAAPEPPRRLLTDWRFVTPPLAVVVLVASWGRDLPAPLLVVIAVVLGAAVLAAVHHAEVVAHRVGEPFGSLLLAVAVTVIEVALIVTLVISGGPGTASLARDTVFAALMITCNGILGLSLFIGAVRYRLAVFNAEGTGAALATVATLAVVCLVLPTFTTARSGPQFSPTQLIFAAVASVALYAAFVSTQTVRHRDFFLPVTSEGKVINDADNDDHADPPTARAALISLVLLLVALVAVVGLAKVLSPAIEETVAGLSLPHSFVGVIIALLVLLPETLAAANAARRNRIQVSLNLALGSAMASIGLTIPVIAIATIWLPGPLSLGLGANQIVLLAITVIVATLTVVPGRATRLQGLVHLILLGAFLLLAAHP
ncbi:calcium:proton antiporter [Streptosporangium sp. DT93]|uniref:calcium:proton antiporter n=1 Tax=Streptosporangium sp. DT93 TaxID=3393428 RepID=UPI003CF844CA